jgi:hypothetical protein
VATCDGTSCDFECDRGYHRCGSGCVALPVEVAALNGYNMGIDVDAAGAVHVAFTTYSSPQGQLRYAVRSPAGGWTDTQVDPSTALHRDPALAVDGAGTVHISYLDSSSGDLMYAERPAAGSWTITNVDTGAAGAHTGWGSSIAIDSAGGVHISYRDTTNHELRYAHRTPAGVWSTETIEGGHWNGRTSIAVDAAGGVHVANESDVPRGVRYCYKPAGGAWVATTAWSVARSDQASLVLDAAGEPHLAFADVDGRQGLYGRRVGGTWTFETFLTGDVGRVSLGVDAAGGVHVSYQLGYTPPDVALGYGYRTPAGVWGNTVVDARNVGRPNDLVVDAAGSPHVAFFDETNRSLLYASPALCP